MPHYGLRESVIQVRRHLPAGALAAMFLASTWRCAVRPASLIVPAALAASLAAGCSSTGIERQRPNRPPDTRLGAGPPDSSATGYRVDLAWSGSDPDGSIDHYDWILADHPAAWDSIADVVVTVPAVDDPRWRQTTRIDSTFVARADTLRRDPRPRPGETPEDVLRHFFERWHTFFVRAVDDRGAPDQTPDYRSFNARTLAPVVALLPPVVPGAELQVPTGTTLRWSGEDPLDKVAVDVPDSSRWVLITSRLRVGWSYSSFPDSLYTLPERFRWSPWRPWNTTDGSGTRAVLRGLLPVDDAGHGIYLFAVQAKDAAGAVTPVFDMTTRGKSNVVPLFVDDRIAPLLVVEERGLGTYVFQGRDRLGQLVAGAGQTIRFRWRADASHYGEDIATYRYGWDLLDPRGDEGWECNWSPDCRRELAPRRFDGGTHRFYLQVRDRASAETHVVLEITVRPLTRTHELLLVDDSGHWQVEDERIEDARWLAVLDSLRTRHDVGFEPGRDIYDVVAHRNEPPPLARVFDYESVIWTVRDIRHTAALQNLAMFFDPFVERNRNAVVRFNYLNVYLDNGGQFWLSGDQPGHVLWRLDLEPDIDRQLPKNLTNWDDPIQPHPGLDSVGVQSLLYRMGVEAIDVGGGGRAHPLRRDRLEHNCTGFRRQLPAWLTTLSFASSVDSGHAHRLEVPGEDLLQETARLYGTDRVNGHLHALSLGTSELRRVQAGETIRVRTSGPTTGGSHAHTFEIEDRSGAAGAPARLEVDPVRWPSPPPEVNPYGGRVNVEIFDMPPFLAAQVPPLAPPAWRILPLYAYESARREDPQRGYVYPLTADGQGSVLLTRRAPEDPHFSRALCGFEVWRLRFDSHLQLAEYILVRQFGLGGGPGSTAAVPAH